MWLLDSGLLPDEERDALGKALRQLGSLQEVVRWAFAHQPPAEVADVIVQDEYCHDVVIAWGDRHYLVFDTT